jgi:chromosome condensin MukBEF complex kleisin-like MukF subunit
MIHLKITDNKQKPIDIKDLTLNGLREVIQDCNAMISECESQIEKLQDVK